MTMPYNLIGSRFRVEYDGFVGTVLATYVTLEGKPGVVMQQDGTKIVHVYGQNRIEPIGERDSGR